MVYTIGEMISKYPIKCSGWKQPIPLQLKRFRSNPYPSKYQTPNDTNSTIFCKSTDVYPMVIHREDRLGNIEMTGIEFYCSEKCYAAKKSTFMVGREIWNVDTNWPKEEKDGKLIPEVLCEKIIHNLAVTGFGIWFKPNNENHMQFLKDEHERVKGSPSHGLSNQPEGSLADSSHYEYQGKIAALLSLIEEEE